MRPFVLTLVLAVVLAAAGRAEGQAARAEAGMDPAAKKHMVLGLRYYNAQEYEKAVAEFQAGYVIDPRPAFLWAIAQSERLNGECSRAIDAYRAYLRTGPRAEQRALAERNIAVCETSTPGPPAHEAPLPRRPPAPRKPVIASAPATRPAPASAPVSRPVPAGGTATETPPVEAPAPEVRTPGRAWYGDRVADALAGTGVLAIAGGAVLLLLADSDASAARTSTSYSDFAGHAGAVGGERLEAGLALGAGVALIAGGIIHFELTRSTAETIAAVPARGGGELVVGGRF